MSCGKYIDGDSASDAGSGICPYCGGPEQAISPAMPDTPAIADVFHPIEEQSPQEKTYGEYMRSRRYLARVHDIVVHDIVSFQDYLAWKGATKRDVAVRVFTTILVWAIFLGLAFGAVVYLFHLKL
jgi:hypothetical protein